MSDPFVYWFVTVPLAFAMVCAAWRIFTGPDIIDRVVALDLLGFFIIAYVAALSIRTDRPEYLGIALVGSVALFLGTIAFAVFLKRGGEL